MKLIYSPTSPYSRKAVVLAMEAGIEGQIQLVPADPWPAGSDVPDYNPLGKVPVLVMDDGLVIYDSPVICEYLDTLHKGRKFFPPEGKARWRALRAQALADGLLDATVLRRLESLRPPEKRSEDWMQRQLVAIRRGVAVLEDQADALEEPMNITHVAVGCALGYLDFRLSEEDWRTSHPKLAAWFEKWRARPSMEATAPPKS